MPNTSIVPTTRYHALNACVYRDVEELQSSGWTTDGSFGSISEIRGMDQLHLYGFILAALRGQDGFQVAPAKRNEVVDDLQSRHERGAKLFVFYLDEFPRVRQLTDAKQQQLANSLRVIKNVFRSFELLLVISSTNATGKYLFSTSTRSRSCGECRWCVVFPLLPRVVVNNGMVNGPALVMEIIRHSRPLFAQFAIEYVQTNPCNGDGVLGDYLDVIMGTLAKRFNRLKRKSDEIMMGQLCLLLGTSYPVRDDDINMIDSHYARLVEQSAFTLTFDGEELWTEEKSSDQNSTTATRPWRDDKLVLFIELQQEVSDHGTP